MATSQESVPDCKNSPENSEVQVPEWILASRGIKLLINNNGTEAEKLFLRYPDSNVMYAGYSFAVFMDALMTFEEDKLNVAITTLKEVEKRCAAETGWFKNISKVFAGTDPQRTTQSLEDELETQIILADSQVCIAILTFLQQDISGYFKGGWVLRKAWKVYQKAYKDILQLYKENIGELQLPDPINGPDATPVENAGSDIDWNVPSESLVNGYIPNSSNNKIPHSKSAYLHKVTENGDARSDLKKSVSINSALSGHSSNNNNLWHTKFSPFTSSLSLSYFTSNFHLFSSQDKLKNQNINKDTIKRLMGAVSFGYGLFQLGVSLLPTSLFKLINLLGFTANRQNGIACLMFARLGVDMRAPLAMLSLLWYHTIVRPFYAIDGSNVQAGVDISTQLLGEAENEFGGSALFLFFKGRVLRLKSDIPGALVAFKQSVENTEHREMKILSLHEVAWCHIIELNYCAAQNTLFNLRATSRWSRAFYTYLQAICAGSCGILTDYTIFKELKSSMEKSPRGFQLDEFLQKRTKLCPSESSTLSKIHPEYWKMFLFEMLYLWNALPSCSTTNIEKIIRECSLVVNPDDEPMIGISELILGCCCCILHNCIDGAKHFRNCLQKRFEIPFNADDAHISAFCHYELGSILVRKDETKEEGKLLLQQINQYGRYDFDQRLNIRVHSILKHL